MTAHGMCGRFEIFESDSKFSNRHVTFESKSNWDVRFEFESNLEASQVLTQNSHLSTTSLIQTDNNTDDCDNDSTRQ